MPCRCINRKGKQGAKEEVTVQDDFALCPKTWRAIPGAHLKRVLNKQECFQGQIL